MLLNLGKLDSKILLHQPLQVLLIYIILFSFLGLIQRESVWSLSFWGTNSKKGKILALFLVLDLVLFYKEVKRFELSTVSLKVKHSTFELWL